MDDDFDFQSSDDDLEDFNFSRTSKKKKTKLYPDDKSEEPTDNEGLAFDPKASTDNYPYTWLLSRFYDRLDGKLSSKLTGHEKISIPPPRLERLGGVKMVWSNFGRTCDKLNRDLEHVKGFFLNELRTEISIDSERKMIMRGRFDVNGISKVLTSYMNTYVICKSCKGCETELTKERGLTRLTCKVCKSAVTVETLKRA